MPMTESIRNCMKYRTLLVVLVVLLAGCDRVKEFGSRIADAYPVQTPTLVFAPGHQMKFGEQVAPVFGNSECPRADKGTMLLFGPNAHEGQFNCLVIAPGTQTVLATIGTPQGAKVEMLTVEHVGNLVMLRRADGTYLTDAN